MPIRNHLRAVLLAAVLAMSPIVLAVAVSVASPPTTTSVKTVARQAVSASACLALTKHDDCYATTTLTVQSVPDSRLANLFVRQASAWTGCSGIYSYTQSMYSAGLTLASDVMQFAFCYDSSGVQVTWGPYCYGRSLPGYGTGSNYCEGNHYSTFPGYAQDSWYIYTWAWPWWHENSLQQVLIYPSWQSWSGCTYC